MPKVQRYNIKINDNERNNIKDKLQGGGIDPKGRVTIHARDIEGSTNKLWLVEDKSNLVVYRGRNWLAQRAFNKDMNATRAGWKNNYISWFSLGTGGAVVGNPLTPSSPALANYELSQHIPVGSGSRYVTVGGRDYHQFDDGYPVFVYDNEIPSTEYENIPSGCTHVNPEDSLSYKCDGFLLGKIRVTVAADEYNGGTEDTDYKDVNEAGLFVSPSNLRSYSFNSTDMQLFARVCFSTIRKSSTRELVFTWYIYF